MHEGRPCSVFWQVISLPLKRRYAKSVSSGTLPDHAQPSPAIILSQYQA